jgi:AAA family ATP:ADP antiporter
MLLIAAGILAATLLLSEISRRSIPDESRSLDGDSEEVSEGETEKKSLFGGFSLVFKDRYLLMIAVLVILLNWVNTTGETILAHFVSEHATRVAAESPGLERGDVIAGFYGDFFFWVNLVGFAMQAFLVARIYRWFGVSGALLILPAIAAIGYGIIVFIPVFSIIRFVKIMENSTDYSIMNTTRQALFLPTDRAVKYEGKTAIDTFFWRFGDLIQAGAFFVGIHYLGLNIPQFALVNLALALVWLVLAIFIGREYRRLVRENVANQAPVLNRPIPDIDTGANGAFEVTLASDTFVDADPGDVLTLYAQLPGGGPLPSWVNFHAGSRTFRGQVPRESFVETEIEVIARDFDGLSASASFFIRRTTANAVGD